MAGIPGNGDGMNTVEQNPPASIATVANARLVLDQWTASLAEVLGSMSDQKPEVRWQPGAAPGADQEILWWEQPFQVAPGIAVWIAAPRNTWEYAGTLTLAAAGREIV